jgi:hypothetical protein
MPIFGRKIFHNEFPDSLLPIIIGADTGICPNGICPNQSTEPFYVIPAKAGIQKAIN